MATVLDERRVATKEAGIGVSDELLAEMRQREREILLASNVSEPPTGSLIVRAHKGTPFFEAKWRDFLGTQRKRRLGRAWLVTGDGDEKWKPRRGRVRDGYMDERRAYGLMPRVIQTHEEELRQSTPALRLVTFDETVAAWFKYLENDKRVKPSTLSGYRSLLAEPAGKRKARIMRAFGGIALFSITTNDVSKFLRKLDREDIAARTVNIHRQVLHSIFEFACRDDSYGLPCNPVDGTTKRPEDPSEPVEIFEPAEIEVVASAARSGLHRGRGGYRQSEFSDESEQEWRRFNEQDAALFIVAAFTGLRMGELLALRWRDVDFRAGLISVSRAMSAGKETSTKSRRPRIVPISQQARAALEGLRRRGLFTGRNDYVFCNAVGDPLDRSAVRKRFIRAQEKAGVLVRRFHDLRHTFGTLASRKFDLVKVQKMMGHSKLSTTERYLHSKPRATDAALLTTIFSGDEAADTAELAMAA